MNGENLLTGYTALFGERFFPGGYFVGRTPFSGEDSSPSPTLPTAPGGSRLRSPCVPWELQLLNRHRPPRTPAVPDPTNPAALRILGFVGSERGLSADELVWTDRFVPGAPPLAQ